MGDDAVSVEQLRAELWQAREEIEGRDRALAGVRGIEGFWTAR